MNLHWQIKNIEAGHIVGFHPVTRKTKDGHVWYREYKSFDDYPRCGGMFVKNGDVDHGNLIQVTHEIAHYVIQLVFLRPDPLEACDARTARVSRRSIAPCATASSTTQRSAPAFWRTATGRSCSRE